LPISTEEVAAGEGALQTWIALLLSTIKKVVHKLAIVHCFARTPAWVGTKSEAWTRELAFAGCVQKLLC